MWCPYAVTGLAIGLVAYNSDLPVTMKTCLYPLLGDRIYGWIGDLVDMLGVLGTIFGVTPGIGLGAIQINRALLVFDETLDPNSLRTQIFFISAITVSATISTISGVNSGIRRLSEICFALGSLLMISVLMLVDTRYLLDLFVQGIGYHIQHYFDDMFYTDALESTVKSYGAADRGRFIPEGFGNTDGPREWIASSKSLGVWFWSISCAPFVGMFLAKISRGRTIREFILGSLIAPGVYCMIWFTIFGGSGIKMERDAAGAGLCCNTGKFILPIPQLEEFVRKNSLANEPLKFPAEHICENEECGTCVSQIIKTMIENNKTFGFLLNEYKNLGQDFGSVTPNRRLSRLSCHPFEQRWFDVMRSFGGIVASLMIAATFLSLLLYFVTTVDSGALVADCLSSNGNPDPPIIQRVFWSCMTSLLSLCLLIVGGSRSFVVLQEAFLIIGFPGFFLLNIYAYAVWIHLQYLKKQPGNGFAIGIFDPLLARPYKRYVYYFMFELFSFLLFPPLTLVTM